jgi:uncharacterized protein (DUF488 family)
VGGGGTVLEGIELFTIGHGSLELVVFLAALRRQRITRVVDVRSIPYSRWAPWTGFGRLGVELQREGIAYEFAGKELGGKPESPDLQTPAGTPDYARIAGSPAYTRAIERVLEAAGLERLALLCSEANPMLCHRERLLARSLRERGASVRHIMSDGNLTEEDPPRPPL